jgi:SNF2 family DNA or RNA helicase
MEEIVIGQPDRISIPLFLHQLKSIEEMERLERTHEIELTSSIYITTKIGVLGDLPGYGKSLSTLGLISRTVDDPLDDTTAVEQKTVFQFVSQIKVEMLQQVKCTLILVNVSLISQWIQELNRTLLRFTAIYKNSEIEDIDLNEYDVILVGNNIYNLFSQVYRKKSWKRFIIDEPASLKLPAMESSHAQFYWLITGTPNELYQKRRTGFLNDLLPPDDMADIFQHLIIKNDDQFVKSSYVMPTTRHLYYKCAGNLSEFFEGIVPDSMLEMLQAGNISGVFNMLENGTQETTTLFDAYKSRKMKRLTELQKEKEMDEKIIEKIEAIHNCINLLDEKVFKYILHQPCMICNKPHTMEPFVLSCCHHIFCGKCVTDICPICKTVGVQKMQLALKQAHSGEEAVHYSHFSQSYSNTRCPYKMSILMDIIGDITNKKILIFSNYNESFVVIKKFLEERNLLYLELRGTKEKRDNTIDAYKTGLVNILLLNTIHSGAGLNLQETSDIILFHKIHEYQRVQVIGRANRIGRKIQLTVHCLE